MEKDGYSFHSLPDSVVLALPAADVAPLTNPSHNGGFVFRVVFTAIASSFLMGFCLSGMNSSIATITLDFRWCYFIECGCNDVEYAENVFFWGIFTKITWPSAYGTFFVMDVMSAEDKLCETGVYYQTVVVAALFVTSIIGSILSGYIVQIGRRFALIIVITTFGVGLLISTISTDVVSLSIGRGISGLAVGMNGTIITLYISEMAPKSVRGFYVALQQLAVFTGLFVSILLGMGLASVKSLTSDTIPRFDKLWWRLMFGLGLVPCICSLILLLFVYKFETPHFNVFRGANDAAALTLSYIYGDDAVPQQLKAILDVVEEMKSSRSKQIGFIEAFCKHRDYRKTILIGFMLFFAVQLGGINAFMANSDSIMVAAGIASSVATALSVLMGIFGILGTLASLWLVDNWGRRPLIVYGLLAETFWSTVAAVAYLFFSDSGMLQFITPVCIIAYVIVFSATMGPVPYIYAGEMFAPEVRLSCLPFCFIINWVFGAVCVVLVRLLTYAQSFIVFAACGLVCFILSYFYILETAGRSIDDSPFLIAHGTATVSKALTVISDASAQRGRQLND